MSSLEDQAREVALKFAQDAITLIARDKSSDVCARKLVAAAAVLHGHLGGAEISQLLRAELLYAQIKLMQALAAAQPAATSPPLGSERE